jgi:hypothetical protein
VRLIFTGTPSWRTVPAAAAPSRHHPARATSSESSASSRSRTGSMQQSCSSLKASHSSRVRERKTSATSRQARAGRLELLLDQSGARPRCRRRPRTSARGRRR